MGAKNQTAGVQSNNTKVLIIQLSILAIVLSNFLYQVVPGLVEQYSLWTDELFTWQFIAGTWNDLLIKHILPDTHPPLYFTLIKIWANIFGFTEISLRSISTLFSVATIFTLWLIWIENNERFKLASLLLISTNPYFLFYAQEARGYSLMILLSTIFTASALTVGHNNVNHENGFTNIRKKHKSKILYYSSGLALSLVHYFGYFYCLAVVFTKLLQQTKWTQRTHELFFIGFISLWPLYHIGIYGLTHSSQLEMITLSEQAWWEPLTMFITACLPFLKSGNLLLDALMRVLFALIALIGLGGFFIRKKGAYKDLLSSNIITCLMFISLALSIFMIANTKIPISTVRNYVVLIPPTSMLIGMGCFNNNYKYLVKSRILRSVIPYLSLITLSLAVALTVKVGGLNLNHKIYGGRDHALLKNTLISTRMCDDGCYSTAYTNDETPGTGILGYYYRETNLKTLDTEDIKQQANSFLPVVGVRLSKHEVKDLAKELQYQEIVYICRNKEFGSINGYLLFKDKYQRSKYKIKSAC